MERDKTGTAGIAKPKVRKHTQQPKLPSPVPGKLMNDMTSLLASSCRGQVSLAKTGSHPLIPVLGWLPQEASQGGLALGKFLRSFLMHSDPYPAKPFFKMQGKRGSGLARWFS